MMRRLEADGLQEVTKPHIRFLRGYSYEVFRDRRSLHPLATTSNPKRLPKIGPWRKALTSEEWFSGT